MKKLKGTLSAGAFALLMALFASSVSAQSLLLHFPMESAGDGAAKLYTADGGTAVSVPGKIGKAVQFDGKALLAQPFNLDHAQYPQVTVTAWVKQPEGARGTRHIVSAGADAGYRLIFNGSLAVRAGRRGVSFSGPRPQSDEWVFVAGVVDMAEGWARTHINEGVSTMTGLDTETTSPRTYSDPENPEADKKAYIFIGGKSHDVFGATRRPLAIDDVRIYAGALSEEEIAAIRDGTAPIDQAIGETEKNDAAPDAEDVDIAALPGDQYEVEDAPTRRIGALPGSLENPDMRTPGVLPDAESDGRTVSQTPSGIENPDVGRLPTGVPDPQYDSPEAAEEAARQREAAAQEAAAAEELNDQQQALQGEGKPRPIGDRKYSAISGFEGAETVVLDLESKFLNEIDWLEASDTPCEIRINNQVSKSWCPMSFLSLDIDGNESSKASVSVAERDRTIAVGSVEVCSSGNDRKRLKGIRVVGDWIKEDGSIVYAPEAISKRERPNCREWDHAVLCPSGTAATGLIAHSNSSSSKVIEIVGLQLICRAVAVR